MAILLFLTIRNDGWTKIKPYLGVCGIYLLFTTVPMLILFHPTNARGSEIWIKIFRPGAFDLFKEVFMRTIAFDETTLKYLYFILPSLFFLFLYVSAKRKTLRSNEFIPALFYIVLTYLIIKIFELVGWPILGAVRYMMVLFTVVFFLVLLAIDQVKSVSIKYTLALAFSVLLLIDVVKNQPHINQDFEGAFSYLHQKEKKEPFILFFLPPSYNKSLSYYYSTLYQLRDTIILDNSILDPTNKDAEEELLDYMHKNSITRGYFMHYYIRETGPRLDFYLKRFADLFDVTPDINFKDVNVYALKLKVPNKSEPNKLKK